MIRIRLSDRQDLLRLIESPFFVSSVYDQTVPEKLGDYYYWGKYQGEYIYSTYCPNKEDIFKQLNDTMASVENSFKSQIKSITYKLK